MRRAARITAAVLLGVALGACRSGPAPRDHFYRLAVPPPAAARERPALDGVLEVDRPTASALLRERSIVYAESAEAVAVDRYAYRLWVDSPTLLVQRALVEYLRAEGLAADVVTPVRDAGERWVVSSHLERLTHLVGGPPRVLVEVEMRLAEAGRGRLLLHRTYRIERPAEGAGVEAAVAAMGRALGEIFARFASDAASAAR